MRKLFLCIFVLLLSCDISYCQPYLGDYVEDETVHFIWSTYDVNGASITRATDGTVSVYKDNGTSQSTAGITDTEDFDSLTGIHACTIDLSADAFYATGANYTVVLSAAVIDGETVNAVLAHFSIENRFDNNVSALNDLSTSDVNGEVLDVMNTDTYAEPGQGNPGATISLAAKINYIYKFLRNKKTSTSDGTNGTISVYDDAGTTVDQKATTAWDGTTMTQGEYATGP